MIRKLQWIKTHAYVTLKSKNSTHFEANDRYGPFDIVWDSDFPNWVTINPETDNVSVPFTNIPFMQFKKEEVVVEKSKRAKSNGSREGTEATA